MISHRPRHALHLLLRTIPRFFRAPRNHPQWQCCPGIVVAAIGGPNHRVYECCRVGSGMITGLRPHRYGHNHEQDQHPSRILEPWAAAHEFALHHSQPDQWAEKTTARSARIVKGAPASTGYSANRKIDPIVRSFEVRIAGNLPAVQLLNPSYTIIQHHTVKLPASVPPTGYGLE
jgi:hypothetical protein